MYQPAAVDGYVLKGNIEGLSDGTHVQLVPVSHDSELPFADTTVVNGQFVFTGKMEEPRAFHLLVKDAYGSRNLILENARWRLRESWWPRRNLTEEFPIICLLCR